MLPSAKGRSLYGSYCSNRCRTKSRQLPCEVCGERTSFVKSRRPDTVLCMACKKDATTKHGTLTMYRHGKCRCVECRRAVSSAHREYVHRRRAEGRPVKAHGSSGPWIHDRVREAVYERDEWTCQLCFEPVKPDSDPQSDWYPSLDHIIPQSKGGDHTMENLRLAHRWCNSIRGADNYHEYLFTVR